MSDFFQNGAITTLHKLADNRLQELERELCSFAKHRPMGLVLPSLFSELEGPALKNIIAEIAKVPYLQEIIIGLDRASEKEFEFAKEFFHKMSYLKE